MKFGKSDPKPAHRSGDTETTYECCGATATYWVDGGLFSENWSTRHSFVHKDDCPTLSDPPLKAFTLNPRCPKCRSAAITTIHAPGRHYDWSTSVASPTPRPACAASGYAYRETEHLDRTCTNCKFEWQEHVA